jgi:hypothetical protein
VPCGLTTDLSSSALYILRAGRCIRIQINIRDKVGGRESCSSDSLDGRASVRGVSAT